MTVNKENKYKIIKDNLEKIEKLAEQAFSDEEISESIGIEAALLLEYLKKHPAIGILVRNAKMRADLEVGEALYKRATGYETIEEHYVYIPDSENEGALKLKEVKKVKKNVPPDASSCLAWLINRRPDKWSKNPNISNELTNSEITKLRKLALIEAEENM